MSDLRVYRYDPTDGSLIGEITDEILACDTDFRCWGGCDNATLEFRRAWADPLTFVADKEDDVEIVSSGVPIFRGRVVNVQPQFGDARQTLELDGWIKRLDEITVLDNPNDDRLVFGTADDSGTHGTAATTAIKTAYDVAEYLVDTYITTDPQSQITKGTFTAPTNKCKLGEQGFAVYANSHLTKVMDTLASMEDCVWGIDANNAFYFIPRATVLATTGLNLRAAKAPSAGWRSGFDAYALGGSFTQKRVGPNWLAVASRDQNGQPGVGTYCYEQALDDNTRRFYQVDAPNIRSGPGRRRFAKGMFRRYYKTSVQVEDLECLAPTRRFEPHLGAVKIYNGDTLLVTEIAGKITVRWAGTKRINVTLGQNQSDPGSGNPLNDPFAAEHSSTDWAQIDTGDGTSDADYPIPSRCIDEDDGFDGDGDDLHSNGDRDDWTDPPGAGVDGVDYGTGVADTTNGFPGNIGNTTGPQGPPGATGPQGPQGDPSAVHVFAAYGVFSP